MSLSLNEGAAKSETYDARIVNPDSFLHLRQTQHAVQTYVFESHVILCFVPLANGTTMAMALYFVFLLAVIAPPYLQSEASAGGIEERKLNDPDVLDTLDFAMNEFNAMQNNLYRMMATKVKDATSQVVKI